MKLDILALVEALEAEHGCDREAIFSGLEEAFATALKKLYRVDEKPFVSIDRESGELTARISDEPLDVASLGRISFYEVKSIFHRRLNEYKEDFIKRKYHDKIGQLLSCKVIKDESDFVLLETTDKVSCLLPRREQVPGENYIPNSFMKVMLIGFRSIQGNTYLLTTRKRDAFVKALLELEIPDIKEKNCEIVKIARDPGYRTKVLIKLTGGESESIGSCLGYMGSRIRNIVEELNGERVDIIEWSGYTAQLIRNSLKPVIISDIKLDEPNKYAQVFVDHSYLSQAIGRGGRNVKLASRLTEWEIDVFELQATNSAADSESTEKS